MARVTKDKPAAKVVKPAKSTKSAKTKKLEKNEKIIKNNDKKTQNLKKRIEQQKIQEEEAKEEEEKSFVLPSDSEDDDDIEENANDDDDDDDETDSELVIHNDIKESNDQSTKSSTQNGHTIIKPSTGNNEKNVNKESKSQRGVIYVGRLPKGFEEKELKKYFQQFGDITRLRLSRNKKSGQSKHYGFIEFKELEVAKIAAETMNNYLLMGHLLKASVLSEDKIHENLFVGANTKFKIIPYAKINMKKHDKARSVEEWEKLNDNHLKNLKTKQETLTAKGIDFDISDI